jgi:hypothetical protein
VPPVWLEIGSRPAYPPGSPAPGLAGTPSAGADGQTRDNDGEWTLFLAYSELTAWVTVLTMPPASWGDLVEFCRELAELDAWCRAGGLPWVEPWDPAPDGAQDGQEAPAKAPPR